jgi:hypothetical protein
MILESRLGISVKQENKKGELTVCLKMVKCGWRYRRHHTWLYWNRYKAENSFVGMTIQPPIYRQSFGAFELQDPIMSGRG